MITLKITKQIARLLDIPYIKSELGDTTLTRKLIIEISNNKAKLFSKNSFCGVAEEIEAVSDRDISLGLELPKQISSLISQDGLVINDSSNKIKINDIFIPMMYSYALKEFLIDRSEHLKKYKQKKIFAIESKQFADTLKNKNLKIVALSFGDQKLKVNLKESTTTPVVEKHEISLIPLTGGGYGGEIYFQRKMLLRIADRLKGKIFMVWSEEIQMPLKIMFPERESFAFWIMRCLENEFEIRTLKIK